jgi:hypothetical protein
MKSTLLLIVFAPAPANETASTQSDLDNGQPIYRQA